MLPKKRVLSTKGGQSAAYLRAASPAQEREAPHALKDSLQTFLIYESRSRQRPRPYVAA